ncbi:MAG: ATP-binding protein [Clostridiaceae bacterium]|nr:ATP-binding protein [Clostridiaceae bacterium]
MDSMTEMFYDESNLIFQEMRRCLLMDQGESGYGQDVVMGLFRNVHTLKADSMMMLYENLATISKELEGLLYCFRGEGKTVREKERFKKVICDYLQFFETETDKLTQGKTPSGSDPALEIEIRQYREEMEASMDASAEEEQSLAVREAMEKPRRQVYYISSAPEESALPEQDEDGQDDAVSDDIAMQEEQTKRFRRKYMISERERGKILQSVSNLMRVNSTLEYALGDSEQGGFSKEQLNKLREIEADLLDVKRALVNTDFVPVAKKMEIVVDEMSQKVGKTVKLLIKGEDTLVDPQMREKISSALIHIIRNAVDHGIEDEDTRERYGKPPVGLIRLKFSTEDGRLKVSVQDDGKGIDTKKVLEKAEKQGLLTKKAEEYTEEEIIDLILLNGLSTAPEGGEYSGRGVGMDVINHNVKELGGVLKITSKQGSGTKIMMKF